MSNHFTVTRTLGQESEKQFASQAHYSQRIREVYISPRQVRQDCSKQSKPSNSSPSKYIKNQSTKASDSLPPRAVPFRRRSHNSRDKNDQSQCNSIRLIDHNTSINIYQKLSYLQKQLALQVSQKTRWQQKHAACESKLIIITEEINKLRQQKYQLIGETADRKRQLQESERNLSKANQAVDLLNKNLKQARLNQKSLHNLSNLQNQLEYLQDRNKKLSAENQELSKTNRHLRIQLDRAGRDSTSESDTHSKTSLAIGKKQTGGSMELELQRLKQQFQKGQSEREKSLELNLQMLEKKLYEKQNQLKKVQIQLSCNDRKKTFTIDDVKNRKDQQIKDLRQKLIRTSKDLKQTKEKIQNEKKKTPKKDSAFIRKVKSSKALGMTSESEVTFQLSSQS